MKRVSLLLGMIALVAISAVPAPVSAADRVLVPQDMPLPLYVGGLGHTGYGPDDWVGTVFYYPPDLIPKKFALWITPVFDPPVGAADSYVEGFFVLGESGDLNSPPTQMVLKNAPGALVPIWFTPAQKFVNGLHGFPPFSWTVASMRAEGSIVGWADYYSEVGETPPGGTFHSLIIASGVMEDGRRFWLQSAISLGYFMNPHTYDLKIQFGP